MTKNNKKTSKCQKMTHTGEKPLKRGPKEKYNVEYGRKALVLFMDGAGVTQVCSALDISKDTYYRWKNKYPEFKDYVERGETHSEAFFETLGYEAMLKKREVDHKFYKTLTDKKFGWSNQSKPDNSVNIENLQINNLTQEDLNDKIKKLQKKLNESED